MTKKWVVVFEYDLEKGLCFIAKKDAGKGEVAFFDPEKKLRSGSDHGKI
jgi:hypothetical protein